MDINEINYDNCIVNLPNSVLKSFGLNPLGKTHVLFDKYLEKAHKNIVLLVLDGLGKNIIESHLNKNSSFVKHLVGECKSVFPSTTVTATTSLMSGLQPCEHSWLGWDCYYPQIDKNVTVFKNVIQGTNIPAAKYNVAAKYAPYKSIVELLKEAGYQSFSVSPFEDPYPNSIEEICSTIEMLCKLPKRKYIYAYWNQPDGYLHRNGCNSSIIKEVIVDIEKNVSELAKRCRDSIILVTADHGHIDVDFDVLQDFPDLLSCLKRLPSSDERSLNLFVKDDKKELFEKLFDKQFGKDFFLVSKNEAIEKKLFGYAKPNGLFYDMLGDYLAISKSNRAIYFNEARWISAHSGISKDEMTVPIIIYDT